MFHSHLVSTLQDSVLVVVNTVVVGLAVVNFVVETVSRSVVA